MSFVVSRAGTVSVPILLAAQQAYLLTSLARVQAEAAASLTRSPCSAARRWLVEPARSRRDRQSRIVQ